MSPRRARRLAAEVKRRPRGGAARKAPAGSQGADDPASGQSDSGQQLARLGLPQVQEWPDGEWVVRQVPGAAATKTYRCPGCDQEILPGVPHVVVWPLETPGPDERRHWHNSCWQRRPRRRGPGLAARR